MKMLRPILIATALLVPALAATPAAINCQENQASTDAVAVSSFVLTTVGDALFVYTKSANATATASVADNGTGGSQNYTQASNSPYRAATGLSGALFTVANTTSAVNGATITATWTAGTSSDIIVCEVSNSLTSAVLDGNVGATCAGCTSLTSGSLTTANANDLLIFCVSGLISLGTQAPGTGYAIPSGATGTRSFCQTKAVSVTQSGVTTSASWSVSATEVISAFFGIKGTSTAAISGQFPRVL